MARSLKPLNEAEIAQIAESRRQVHELMPEMVDELKEYVDEGMMEGWRSVTYIGPPREKDPRTITLAEMQVGPWNLTEKGRKHGNGG